MIYFIDKVLENLQAYIPLFQALIWPIVVLVAIVLFREHICSIIEAVRNRIATGSGIKAGLFEMPPTETSSAREQVAKLELEASEEVVPLPTSESNSKSPSSSSTISAADHREFMASIMLAEDLVMKKISAELNLKIVRNVKVASDSRYIFDGVAVVEKKFIAIEVKMLKSENMIKHITTRSLDRLNTYYTSLSDDAKRNFSLIFAVVIQEGAPDSFLKQIDRVRIMYQFPIHTLCYNFADLKNEFGID